LSLFAVTAGLNRIRERHRIRALVRNLCVSQKFSLLEQPLGVSQLAQG